MLGHGAGIGYMGPAPGWAPLTISVWLRGRCAGVESIPLSWCSTFGQSVVTGFTTAKSSTRSAMGSDSVISLDWRRGLNPTLPMIARLRHH